ncbi:hypothetical protein CRYUN_Cryun04dG0107500 [Craigia yunnanensis]
MERIVGEKYKLGRKIGSGSFGEIFLATHVNTDETVTVKIVLCKPHPVEFASYFHYCRSLKFDQRPDYGFLKRLFRDLFIRKLLNYLSSPFFSCYLHYVTCLGCYVDN